MPTPAPAVLSAPNRGAQLLRAWRDAQTPRVTQRQLSDDTGIHEQTLSTYERGASLPTRRHALVLEQVAAIPPAAWDEPAQIDHTTTMQHGGHS